MDEMESIIGINVTTEDIIDFQSWVAKPFFMLLKENIINWFSSDDVASSFIVFLKELATNSMLHTICPSLSTLAKVCLTIPVGTTSVEHSFS